MSGRKPGCGRPRATRGGSLRGFASWGLRGGLFWRLGSFCGLGEEMMVVMWTFSKDKSLEVASENKIP